MRDLQWNSKSPVGAILLLLVLTVGGYWSGSATATPTCDDTCEKNKCVIWFDGMGEDYVFNYDYSTSSNCGAWFWGNRSHPVDQ